jgi:hypothetical protein
MRQNGRSTLVRPRIGGAVGFCAPKATSNFSHDGEWLYTGNFTVTPKSALPSAVGTPEGQRMHISGLENLKRTC